VYLDFEKAFDKVPHQRLLLKLHAYGIRGKYLEWIKNFLNERKKRVVLGKNKSDWADIMSGVPQGSVLGPILFIIFINDLSEVAKNVFKMYADDGKTIANVQKPEGRIQLQKDIDNVTKWCEKWCMN
jgi:ribonuclease P/MRP protein subunit RPP40